MSGYKIPTVTSKHHGKYVANMPSQEGKIIAITGTSTGLGNIAAKAIALKGGHVLALNRQSERATAASTAINDEIRTSGGTGKVEDVACDLQNLSSVRAAAAEVRKKCQGRGLNALVCNAGIMAMPDKTTGDGFPVEMQTNHLSHFMLTSALLPTLQEAAKKSGSARIVTHSSGARLSPGSGVKAEHYANYGKGMTDVLGGHGARWERYHQTKMANASFILALKDKLAEKDVSNIVCACACPGLAASNLQATTSEHGGGMGLGLLMKFAQSAEDGALPLLHCIVGEGVESGDLYIPGNKGPLSWIVGDGITGPPAKKDMSKEISGKQVNKDAMWEASEEAVGAFFSA